MSMSIKEKILYIVAIVLMTVLFIIISDAPREELPDIPIHPCSLTLPAGEVGYNVVEGWNLISLPDTTSKQNIIITYQGNSYSWQQAVDNGYVADIIMGYNGTDYVETDTIHEFTGYWLYSFISSAYLSSEISVVYGSKLVHDDNASDIMVDKVIISNTYDSPIYYNTISWDSMEFYYIESGTLEE